MKVIQDFEVKGFVELGFHRGGLASCLIARSFMTDFWYLGTEIDRKIMEPAVIDLSKLSERSQIMITDNAQVNTIVAVNGWMAQREGQTLIYCDGGDKPREFRIYSRLLDVGDLIGVHDLGKEITEESFERYGDLRRIKEGYLKRTTIALFVKD